MTNAEDKIRIGEIRQKLVPHIGNHASGVSDEAILGFIKDVRLWSHIKYAAAIPIGIGIAGLVVPTGFLNKKDNNNKDKIASVRMLSTGLIVVGLLLIPFSKSRILKANRNFISKYK